MEAPPTWFDFSTECIYTSQKHKKHKVWLDGFCTCIFVRGWVVLKLFPEGASSNSEPLEEWRLPPGPPSSVAQQEIELQVYLVQLLGRPQRLDELRQLQKQHLESQTNANSRQPPLASQLHNSPASGGSVLPAKRRLPGGLFRRSGTAVRAPPKHPGAPIPGRGSEPLESGVNGSEPITLAQRHGTPAVRTTFVPPLRSTGVEPQKAPTTPSEVWGVQAARAVLLLTCPCCGCSECSQCSPSLEVSTEGATATAEFFSALFGAARTPTLPQLQQKGREQRNQPILGNVSATEIEGDPVSNGGKDFWAGAEAEGGQKGVPALYGGAKKGSCHITPHKVTTSLQRCSTAPGPPIKTVSSTEHETSRSLSVASVSVPAANVHHSSTSICSGGSHIASSFHPTGRSRFAALAAGAMPPHGGPIDGGRCNALGSPQFSGVPRQRQALPCNTTFSNLSRARPTTNPSDTYKDADKIVQGFVKPQQQPQQWQQLPSDPQQRRMSMQRFEPPAKTGSSPAPSPNPLPLLLAEGLPQVQVRNLADLVPVTFCTASNATLPFSATDAAARYACQLADKGGEPVSAKQLALYYFNCLSLSLQAALTEPPRDSNWSNGVSAGSDGVWFFVKGAQLRVDGKRFHGMQQRKAQVQRQRKLKQLQFRKDQQRRQRQKHRLSSGAGSSSASEAEEQNATGESSAGEFDSPVEAALLLDLSNANVLPRPSHITAERPELRQEPRVPFEAATAMKARLGRNDIWALSTDGRFDDWSSVVLVRSLWRGASPHSQCVKVSVVGPWPSTQGQPQLSLLSFDGSSQGRRATLPPLPPLLRQIRQLLQGGSRVIDGVYAVWVGRFQDELVSTEGCNRLFEAEAALHVVAAKNLGPFACAEAAALEVGLACAARVVGIGCVGGGTPSRTAADAKLMQPIELNLSSRDAEQILLDAAAPAARKWTLNLEQQQILVAVARWLGFSDGRQPLESREKPLSPVEIPGCAGCCEDASPMLLRPLECQGASCLPQAGDARFSETVDEKARMMDRGTPSTYRDSPPGGGDSDFDSSSLFAPDDDYFSDNSTGSGCQQQDRGQQGNAVQTGSENVDKGRKVLQCPESQSNSFDVPGIPQLRPSTPALLVAGTAHSVGQTSTKGHSGDKNISLQDDTSLLRMAANEQPPRLPSASGCSFGDETAEVPRGHLPRVATEAPLAAAAATVPLFSSPVLLVQGVFGAGKSTLLAACLTTLCRLLETAKARGRVLLVCATNAAVDGVLLRLLRQFDCSDFARIGRLSEMNPELLPYAVSSSADRNTALQEFRNVLTQLLAASDARTPLKTMAKKLLTDINSGSFPPSVQRWKRRRIWATTCSTAASSDIFSDGSSSLGNPAESKTGSCFPFLLMDEASQVQEPLAAAILMRARPLRCLFLGDTRQLPPTTHLRGSASAAAASLFSRLIRRSASRAVGAGGIAFQSPLDRKSVSTELQAVQSARGDLFVSAFQMRVQYRCHPELGCLAAELFYGPCIIHGVSAEQRLPLFPDWGGALCCAFVRGGMESKAFRSLLNVPEAKAVAHLVRSALHTHTEAAARSPQGEGSREASRFGPLDVGVICFYRAQVEEVRRQLRLVLPGGLADTVRVSTVDAFQGSEKEVILLSLVRTPAHIQKAGVPQQQFLGSTADFLTCPQRVCVALTRARRQLVVVGAEAAFKQYTVWSHVCSRATKFYV